MTYLLFNQKLFIIFVNYKYNKFDYSKLKTVKIISNTILSLYLTEKRKSYIIINKTFLISTFVDK